MSANSTKLVLLLLTFIIQCNTAGCSSKKDVALWGDAQLNGSVSGKNAVASYYVTGYINDWRVATLFFKNESDSYVASQRMVLNEKFVTLNGIQEPNNFKVRTIYYNNKNGEIEKRIIKVNSIEFQCLQGGKPTLVELNKLWLLLNGTTQD